MVEALLPVRCVARHYDRQVAKTKALKLSSLANRATSNICRDSSFVAIVRSIKNFSATFEREHGVSFPAARIVDIVEEMVSFNFLTGNGNQIYQRYILLANFVLQRPDMINNFEKIDEEEAGSRTLGISHLG